MGMLLLGLPFLYGVAMAAAIAVLFTMIAALTLLPALLTIVGRWVNRLRIPGLGSGARSIDETRLLVPLEPSRSSGGPWLAALLSGGLLLAALHPDPLAAARHQRRRHRPGRERPRARPTTCSPKASGPASTARS